MYLVQQNLFDSDEWLLHYDKAPAHSAAIVVSNSIITLLTPQTLPSATSFCFEMQNGFAGTALGRYGDNKT